MIVMTEAEKQFARYIAESEIEILTVWDPDGTKTDEQFERLKAFGAEVGNARLDEIFESIGWKDDGTNDSIPVEHWRNIIKELETL